MSPASTARRKAFQKEVIKQISVLSIQDTYLKHLNENSQESNKLRSESTAELTQKINKHSGTSS